MQYVFLVHFTFVLSCCQNAVWEKPWIWLAFFLKSRANTQELEFGQIAIKQHVVALLEGYLGGQSPCLGSQLRCKGPTLGVSWHKRFWDAVGCQNSSIVVLGFLPSNTCASDKHRIQHTLWMIFDAEVSTRSGEDSPSRKNSNSPVNAVSRHGSLIEFWSWL